jgi:hypothetical protein
LGRAAESIRGPVVLHQHRHRLVGVGGQQVDDPWIERGEPDPIALVARAICGLPA